MAAGGWPRSAWRETGCASGRAGRAVQAPRIDVRRRQVFKTADYPQLCTTCHRATAHRRRRAPPRRRSSSSTSPMACCASSPATAASRRSADYIDVPDVYAAGRLDADSEGLVCSPTTGGSSAHRAPAPGLDKRYLAQVEGIPEPAALARLGAGVTIGSGRDAFRAAPATAVAIAEPALLLRAAHPHARIDSDVVGGNRPARRQESSGPAHDRGHRSSDLAAGPRRDRCARSF